MIASRSPVEEVGKDPELVVEELRWDCTGVAMGSPPALWSRLEGMFGSRLRVVSLARGVLSVREENRVT